MNGLAEKDALLDFIFHYRDSFCPGPTEYYHRNKKFDIETYQKWSLDEMINWIMCRTGIMSQIDSLNDFRMTMLEYSCGAHTDDASYIFATAADMAQTIMDEFYAL